jgi:hypothetical protein
MQEFEQGDWLKVSAAAEVIGKKRNHQSQLLSQLSQCLSALVAKQLSQLKFSLQEKKEGH